MSLRTSVVLLLLLFLLFLLLLLLLSLSLMSPMSICLCLCLCVIVHVLMFLIECVNSFKQRPANVSLCFLLCILICLSLKKLLNNILLYCLIFSFFQCSFLRILIIRSHRSSQFSIIFINIYTYRDPLKYKSILLYHYFYMSRDLTINIFYINDILTCIYIHIDMDIIG